MKLYQNCFVIYISSCRYASERSTKKPPNTWSATVVISLLSLLYNLHLHHALHCMTSKVTRIRGVLFSALVMSQNCTGFKGSGGFAAAEDKRGFRYLGEPAKHFPYFLLAFCKTRISRGQHQLVNSLAQREDLRSLSYLCGVHSITSVNPAVSLRICCSCKCQLLFLINRFKRAYNSAKTLCSTYTFRGPLLCTREGCL